MVPFFMSPGMQVGQHRVEVAVEFDLVIELRGIQLHGSAGQEIQIGLLRIRD